MVEKLLKKKFGIGRNILVIKLPHNLDAWDQVLDWSTERFTLDDEYQHAVLSAFIQLFEEGLIYQGKRLVNWDPVLETSLSDLGSYQ